MADDGPVPMDLGNVGTQDARTTQCVQDASNDMSYDEVCAIAWTGNKAGTGTSKKGPNGAGMWYRRKGFDEWTSDKRDDGGMKGGKKGPRAANLIGTVTKTKRIQWERNQRERPR